MELLAAVAIGWVLIGVPITVLLLVGISRNKPPQ